MNHDLGPSIYALIITRGHNHDEEALFHLVQSPTGYVGMAGALYAYFIGQIFPQFAFDPLFDISIALMAFLGGLGTVWGPLLGALVLEALQQYFTVTFSASQIYLVIYGVLFLVVVLLLPRGVIPTVEQWVLRWRTREPVEERSGESVDVNRDMVKAAG